MKRTRWFTKKNSFFLLILALFLSLFQANRNAVRAFNNNNGRNLPFCDTLMTPVQGAAYGKAFRTFYLKKNRQEELKNGYQEAVTRGIREFNRRRAEKRMGHASDAIEITYDDMVNAYAFGSDFLEYYAFPENVTMDMGDYDPYLTTPQTWVMPEGLDFESVTRKIVDPETTPYPDLAADATHCLWFESPYEDGDVYMYYWLDEEGLYDVGVHMDKFDYTDSYEEEMLPLPLDVETEYYSGWGEEDDWTVDGDTTWYSDTEYYVDAWYYISEAWGTLQTPDDGPVEVIKIAYQWIWSEWEVDEDADEDVLLDYENGTEIYFYSKDGHQLMISLDSLGAETTGEVTPDRIYYQKVRKQGTAVEPEPSTTVPKFAFYPNPTRGMVRFNAPTTFEVYDVLGRRVLSRENAVQADLSQLARGMYFLKPEKSMTQKLIVQK